MNAVNDVRLTNGANQTVNEDAGAQTVTVGPRTSQPALRNEATQTVDFIVTNNNNSLFSSAGRRANGTLTTPRRPTPAARRP